MVNHNYLRTKIFFWCVSKFGRTKTLVRENYLRTKIFFWCVKILDTQKFWCVIFFGASVNSDAPKLWCVKIIFAQKYFLVRRDSDAPKHWCVTIIYAPKYFFGGSRFCTHQNFGVSQLFRCVIFFIRMGSFERTICSPY